MVNEIEHLSREAALLGATAMRKAFLEAMCVKADKCAAKEMDGIAGILRILACEITTKLTPESVVDTLVAAGSQQPRAGVAPAGWEHGAHLTEMKGTA